MKEKEELLNKLNALNKGTMMEQLQIEYLEADDKYVKARMPVNHRTMQPMGILHGGASIALAETVAGIGSSLMIDTDVYSVRGAQVSANHVGEANKGFAFAEGKLIHRGKNTHVWNIDISNDAGRALSTCRITNFIIKK
ncbi:MAG: hotdog fold thioesterase [Bacteroidota bacterium]